MNKDRSPPARFLAQKEYERVLNMRQRIISRKEATMPSLKNLLQELRLLGVDPDDVRISATEYDDIIDDAEQPDRNPEENPDD